MQPGTTVGPYEVRSHLGDGGMGSVWLAEDTRLHRRVALKTLHAAKTTDVAGRDRLRREARAAAINHPHIATVYDVLEINDEVVIVFEFVEGRTLAQEIAGALPIERVLAIGVQLAKALVAAHSQGVVHRDLKPSNVIVGPDGDIKVLDFGVARLLPMGTTSISGETVTAGGFAGTPAYAAPEQLLSSAVDERADLYALGVMLFEMSTGRRPFAGHDPVALATAKLASAAPSVSSTGTLLPPAFDALVARLLERQPADRPSSASEVLGALRTVSGESSTTSLPRVQRPVRWIAAAALLATIVAAAVFTIGLPSRATPEDRDTAQPVVAVMPLRNTSGDPSQDYLASGLAESLIANLASSRTLTVLSRSAIADALTTNPDGLKATNALGANVVVEGSLQRSGDQLRINVNVIKGDRTIWGGTFDGTAGRVFDLQTRMALAVGEALAAKPPGGTTPSTTKASAQEAYWRGRAFLDRRDVQGNVDAALSAFSESIQEDSNFALGHAGLGRAYWIKYAETRDAQYARLSVESGRRASALDADEPEVLNALAVSLDGTGQRDEAITLWRQAIELRPTFDDARRQLANVLASQGQMDAAVSEFQRAIALRPNFWGGYSDLGLALFRAGRYDEAAAAFEQVVKLQPDSYLGFQQLGSIYQAKGATEQAVAAYEQSIGIRPSFGAYSNLGTLQYTKGRYADAVTNYQRAIALRPTSALLYRNLGDAQRRLEARAEALESYRKAVQLVTTELTINPSNARSRAALAVYLMKAEQAAKALAEIRKALELSPEDVQVRLRAAVVHALAGRRAEALSEIQAAVERGYSTAAIRDEEDFSTLAQDPGFQQLIATSK